MSGISGFISKRAKKEEIIKKMGKSISHRGKVETIYHDKNIALAERLFKGQNKCLDKNGLSLIFDGYLINRDDLAQELKLRKSTDHEIILEGYKIWGEDVVNHLNGPFAFVIWNKSSQTLFAARDHFGVKPFYYLHLNNELIFASEIKAILTFPDYQKELNKDVIAPYLRFGLNPCSETFFKNIFSLEPGHTLTFENNVLNIYKYFKLNYQEQDYPYEDAINDIDKTVKTSVAKSFTKDEKVGAFLSGGVDSSYLASLIKPQNTFTIGYEEQKYNESHHAKELSDMLGSKNHIRNISKDDFINVTPKVMYHLDQPISDPGSVAIYFGARSASKLVDVASSGEGADEFFGGYYPYQDKFKFPIYSKIPFSIRRFISYLIRPLPEFKSSNFLVRRGLKIEEWYAGLSWVIKERNFPKFLKVKPKIKIKDITAPIYEDVKNANDINKMMAIDTNFFLIKNFLVNMDKIGNIFSLDIRMPFINMDIYNVAKQLPEYAKVNPQTTKPWFRMAAKKAIPNEAYNRNKLGFPVPLREWLKEEDIQNIIKKSFEQPIIQELFYQDKLFQLMDEHKHNKKDNYREIWTIYCFSIWYQVYFENSHDFSNEL